MLEIRELLTEPAVATATLTLVFELRQKSRLRTHLDDGTEVGWFLERGTVLREGDLLRADNGLIIEIKAAAEAVSTAGSDDPLLLLRAAYHLGNRHVPLQIDQHWLRYQHDHVLDELVLQLGLSVSHEQAAFHPEAGAYGGGHQHHH